MINEKPTLLIKNASIILLSVFLHSCVFAFLDYLSLVLPVNALFYINKGPKTGEWGGAQLRNGWY